MNREGKFLKKLWCCVGGKYNEIVWRYFGAECVIVNSHLGCLTGKGLVKKQARGGALITKMCTRVFKIHLHCRLYQLSYLIM